MTAVEVSRTSVGRISESSFFGGPGFLLPAAIALPLGIWMDGKWWKVLQPLTEFVRYVPVPALIPILMLLFGLDELSKVMLIFVGTFFQLVLMVADEVRRVPYELLQVSYTLGAKKGEVVRLVLMRAAMPGIRRMPAASGDLDRRHSVRHAMTRAISSSKL